MSNETIATKTILEHNNNVKIIIYEPMLEEKTYLEYKVVNNLYEFKKLSDIIIANRLANEILDVRKNMDKYELKFLTYFFIIIFIF